MDARPRLGRALDELAEFIDRLGHPDTPVVQVGLRRRGPASLPQRKFPKVASRSSVRYRGFGRCGRAPSLPGRSQLAAARFGRTIEGAARSQAAGDCARLPDKLASGPAKTYLSR